MNKETIIALILLGVSMPNHAANITAKVTGGDGNEGTVRVVLFSEGEKSLFPKRIDRVELSAKAPVRSGSAEIVLKDIPPGRYAAFVFHDKNGNDIMDHSWLGFPQERFGFLENYVVKILPPDFEDVAFSLAEKDRAFDVELQSF